MNPPAGQQSLRRAVGQSLVVTCRATGARLRLTLSAVRNAGDGTATLLVDDPAGAFVAQPTESYIPARATVNAVRDAVAPARDK